MSRQIHESCAIEESKADIIMNSKNEWNGSRMPRIKVEVGDKVITGEFRGQGAPQSPASSDNLEDRGEDLEAEELDILLWEEGVRKTARTTKTSAIRSRQRQGEEQGGEAVRRRNPKAPRTIDIDTDQQNLAGEVITPATRTMASNITKWFKPSPRTTTIDPRTGTLEQQDVQHKDNIDPRTESRTDLTSSPKLRTARTVKTTPRTENPGH